MNEVNPFFPIIFLLIIIANLYKVADSNKDL